MSSFDIYDFKIYEPFAKFSPLAQAYTLASEALNAISIAYNITRHNIVSYICSPPL